MESSGVTIIKGRLHVAVSIPPVRSDSQCRRFLLDADVDKSSQVKWKTPIESPRVVPPDVWKDVVG